LIFRIQIKPTHKGNSEAEDKATQEGVHQATALERKPAKPGKSAFIIKGGKHETSTKAILIHLEAHLRLGLGLNISKKMARFGISGYESI